ncbi:MAG: hypothetical protein EA351_01560 [Gemmatimonadales bacterium]|nr:MAG: hypothetical protein EA351_01560 [Gemmatimonadales bacterium]
MKEEAMLTSYRCIKQGGATGWAGCSIFFRGCLAVLVGVLTIGIGDDARAQSPASSAVTGGDTLSLTVVAKSDLHFSDVVDVVELRDGGVLVLDRIARHVFRLDPSLSGEPAPISTRGEGPGEYVVPRLLRGLTGDSIGIHDGNLGRLTVLDPEGRFVRTIREDGIERSFGVDIDELGRGYHVTGAGDPRQGRVPGDPDADRVLMWDLDTRSWKPVATVETGSLVVADRPTLVSQRIIFQPTPTWAVAPDGTVAVITADPYRVTIFDPEQGRIDGPEVPFDPVPVTEADRQAWREAAAEPRPMEVGRIGDPPGSSRIQMVELPPVEPGGWADAMPPFMARTVRFAPDGRIWVPRTTELGASARADIFNREGVRTARVVLEEGVRIVGFGEGVVYAVAQNEYGEEAVVRLAEDGSKWAGNARACPGLSPYASLCLSPPVVHPHPSFPAALFSH